MLLTKSKYLHYLACPGEFWLAQHRPELMPNMSKDALFIINQGNVIDTLAGQWFMGGCIVEEHEIDPKQVENQVTKEANGCLVIADIVVWHDPNSCSLFEVKAATGVKSEHIPDVAFQKMVFEAAGVEVKQCYLVHVDKDYTFTGELDLCGLLTVENITNQVEKIKAETAEKSKGALALLTQETMPTEVRICGNKGNCVHLQTVFGPLPSPSVFEIARISDKHLDLFLKHKIFAIEDVPDKLKLSAKQHQQVQLTKAKEIFIDEKKIEQQFAHLEFPLYFLDYETFPYVLPSKVGMRPYMHLVFQYSLHIVQKNSAKVEHFEFLLENAQQSEADLIANMRRHIADEGGTMVVWNQSFELARNKEMAQRHPEHSAFLMALNTRAYDLMGVFKNALYLDPAFKGSYSIKAVLPVLCPDLSYDTLGVKNGTEAIVEWQRYAENKLDETEKSALKADLLAYCKLDTWAMVRIYGFLLDVLLDKKEVDQI